MAEMNDSIPGAVRNTPKDAQVMANILKEMGVEEYEPRLINQMLEFTYRYATSILEDAQLYSAHAKKKNIDGEDVKLAISMQQERNFTSVPDRDLTAEIAKSKNSTALPAVKSTAGMRLPPDRYSLTSCNYRLKPASKKNRTVHTVSRMNVAGLPQTAGMKGSSTGVSKSVLKGVSTPVVPRPIINVAKPTPTPIIKFSDGNKVSTSSVTFSPMASPVASSPSVPITSATQILMPIMMKDPDIKLPLDTDVKPDDGYGA